MSTLVTDVRYAVRMLWKDRRFTLVALVALALGIGATSAIYTVVDSVLLRPLPYPDPAALVEIQSATRNGPGASSLPDFEDYRARNHSLSSLAAYYDRRVALTGSADPQQLAALSVTPGFFDVLGTQPIVGRALGANDAVVGSPSILISYALWQGRFRGDPDIVGRGLSVDGQPAVIVGVMPASFRFPLDAEESPQVYLPLPREPSDEILATRRGLHAVALVGRMTPGTTRARAQADFDAVVATMRADHPGESEDKNLWRRCTSCAKRLSLPCVRRCCCCSSPSPAC